MIIKVFAFIRPPDQVLKTVEEKEEESDESNFEKKNPKRDKTKAKEAGMKEKLKRKNKEGVNPTVQENSKMAFNRRVTYKQARFKIMKNEDVTLPLNVRYKVRIMNHDS
ncbi:unnamed protein product [Lactuca saligna]|uniref:Uncharacterized protein n=1 Tax=Lactuca saligna TaxID=75948 RepID=A0AA35UY16_LACSI|nr:unnamed protein product [Lactuca saligna]